MQRQRRDFLILSAVGIFAPLTFALLTPARSEEPYGRYLLRAKKCLGKTISDWKAARMIGKEYLYARPHEADRATLLTDLMGPANLESPQHLRKRIAELKMRDFENGDIVIIDGWILARAEARICALTYMI